MSQGHTKIIHSLFLLNGWILNSSVPLLFNFIFISYLCRKRFLFSALTVDIERDQRLVITTFFSSSSTLISLVCYLIEKFFSDSVQVGKVWIRIHKKCLDVNVFFPLLCIHFYIQIFLFMAYCAIAPLLEFLFIR